jgi:hypothetical protein
MEVALVSTRRRRWAKETLLTAAPFSCNLDSLVEGVATVGIAIICIFILPDVPQKARLLTSQEKDRLVYRLQMDRGQVDNSSEISAFKGFMMAVTDPKTWLLCGILTST